MCYSAMVKQSVKKMGFEFRVRESELDQTEWNFRVYPHGQYPVLLNEQNDLYARLMNYSLIPSWSKERRPKFATYNARIETLAEKPTWKDSLLKYHCIVPVTSFFESCYEGSHAGNVVQFHAPPNKTYYSAGLYSDWVDKSTGEIVGSFAMITKDPSDFIKEVGHDRSPLFLEHEACEEWLALKPKTAKEGTSFLKKHATDPELFVEIERPLKAGWEKKK